MKQWWDDLTTHLRNQTGTREADRIGDLGLPTSKGTRRGANEGHGYEE
jgi:hypothetical protein